ncbi:MAG: hypothetical protein M3O01_08345, partial [Pseudomonadota bacterium]|nr:hypothetical protein [Pseudomonadota bacterium]
MRAASTTSAIGLALWIAASSSQAVGFGRVSNSTQIGQPLNFAAVVNLEPDEQLARECVSAEVQSGDNKLQPQLVRATLEPGTGSERRVRVTTSALIDEPVVTVSVTLGCNSKVTRRFVAFVDPPLIDIPRTADTEPTPPPQRVDSQVSPILSIVQGSEGGAPAPRDLAPSATTRLQPRLRAVAASPSEPRLDEVAAPRPPRRQAAASHRAHVA